MQYTTQLVFVYGNCRLKSRTCWCDAPPFRALPSPATPDPHLLALPDVSFWGRTTAGLAFVRDVERATKPAPQPTTRAHSRLSGCGKDAVALSIKSSIGSRLRLRRTRSMGFNSFEAGNYCKKASFAKSSVIDVRQCISPRIHAGDGTPRLFSFQAPVIRLHP
jgi:hypothetical protein